MAMTLADLKEKIDFYIKNGCGDYPVMVTLKQPSVGARAFANITGIYPGFDLEHGQMRLETDTAVTSYRKDRDLVLEAYKVDIPIGNKTRHLVECPKCENHLRKGDKYCSRCGQRIKQ